MASLVTVATYYEPSEALVALSCLNAYGLVAGLSEWHHASVAWHHVYALKGIRLWTADTMADEARELLDVATTDRQAAATTKTRFGLIRSDITFVEIMIAVAAFAFTGLPCPVWRRRTTTS